MKILFVDSMSSMVGGDRFMMRCLIYILSVCFILGLSACTGASRSQPQDASATAEAVTDTVDIIVAPQPRQWHVAQKWTAADIADFGIDRLICIDTISDSIMRVIMGKSYDTQCPLKPTDLRYLRLLHVNAEGDTLSGELICHEAVSQELLEIFTELYEAHYPIERMVLIDTYDADDEASMLADNTSCFNFRKVTGGQRVSRHGYGMAVDINPLYNPYVHLRDGMPDAVSPIGADPYAVRDTVTPYTIQRGDACYRAFRSRGWRWGGDWRRKVRDYQHFEK